MTINHHYMDNTGVLNRLNYGPAIAIKHVMSCHSNVSKKFKLWNLLSRSPFSSTTLNPTTIKTSQSDLPLSPRPDQLHVRRLLHACPYSTTTYVSIDGQHYLIQNCSTSSTPNNFATTSWNKKTGHLPPSPLLTDPPPNSLCIGRKLADVVLPPNLPINFGQQMKL